MLWFPLVFLALQNRLGHGLGRTQLRGFRDRYPQFARSNVLQTWTMCQAVCFIKGGLGSSSSTAGIHLSVVHQNLQCPQMEGWGSVCSSAWSRLEVSIFGVGSDSAPALPAGARALHCLWAVVQSHFGDPSWYFYPILYKSTDFLQDGSESSEARRFWRHKS